MSQVVCGRPLRIFDRRNQSGFEPAALIHFCCRQTFSPSAFFVFRKVCEWAPLDSETAETFEDTHSERWSEPVAHARDIHQLLAFVVADQNRIEIVISGDIP